MSDLTAYRSTHPDVLAVIEKWRADMDKWHADSAALLTELGFTDRSFMVHTSMGHRWISGIEYHADDPVPTGWRVWKDRNGQSILTPHKGRKAGKDAQAKLQTCKVPNLPQANLPGMPGDRICNGAWRSPGLREMAGAVYVTWTADALPEIPASGPAREAHLGDDERQRKIVLANDVDLAIWERLKLSEYYAAVEAAEAASGGEGR
jgi:hypothetical protein